MEAKTDFYYRYKRGAGGGQGGFTILELMIATSVLSVVLLLATALIINIGNLYYKGDNVARIQDGVRSALDQVTQDIEFSSSSPSPDNPVALKSLDSSYHDNSTNVHSFCMEADSYEFRYTYVDSSTYQLGNGGYGATELNHLLWRDQINTSQSCNPVNLTLPDPDNDPSDSANDGINGTELVPPNSRLLNFSVTSPSANTYSVTIGMAYGSQDLTTAGNICKGGAGDRFCATDSLTSVITQRTPPESE